MSCICARGSFILWQVGGAPQGELRVQSTATVQGLFAGTKLAVSLPKPSHMATKIQNMGKETSILDWRLCTISLEECGFKEGSNLQPFL